MKSYFYILNETTGGPPTHKHDTIQEAFAEAKRLALKEEGCDFAVLECVGKVVSKHTPEIVFTEGSR